MGKPAQVWIKTKKGAPRTFDQNVPYLKEIANLSSKGYFGKKGSSVRVRRIESEDPVSMFSEFFATATLGAIDSKIDGKAVVRKMLCGTIVTGRITSSSDGSPAIDLNIVNSKYAKSQKLHFVKGRQHDGN